MIGLVGPIAGPIPYLPEGSSASLTDLTGTYDVALGGLGFRLGVSDETPYERATAQFRKEQADQSQHYGDHSLLGWWTVGQMSFHLGAGIRFYDPDDEVTLNRFDSSDGLDVFTTPGEVSLGPGVVDFPGYTGLVSGAAWGGAGNGFTAVLDAGALRFRTDAGVMGSVTTASGAIPTAAGVAPDGVYYVAADALEFAPVPGGAGVVYYTHPTSKFNSVWYAKDRLWGVADDGSFYHLAPTPAAPPVAVGSGDLVFKAGKTWGNTWCVVDTPGPLLVGNDSRIYAVSVADDGTVPALSGPVQVAQLPTGESLRGMIYHLGFLVLTTTHGFRVAVVADNGTVTYGPLLKEWAKASTATETGAPARVEMATHGSSVYLAGADGTIGSVTPVLYRIDLAHQVGESLEFAWTTESTAAFAGTPSSFGVTTWQGRHLMAYGGAQVVQLTPGSEGADSGTLTTAFHRMGTLDPKKFHAVQVRVGGGAGQVRVSKVLEGGTVVSLYTIDVADSKGETITLAMAAPAEMLALRFTLTAGAGGSPKLLGYQLKALPAPRRQRLIRLPIMLHDVEQRGTTRPTGHANSAWKRLSALEEMEQSGGVFTFQDFRTGEAGEVYIESIEHSGKTPSGRLDSGFGGIVFVTVRKL